MSVLHRAQNEMVPPPTVAVTDTQSASVERRSSAKSTLSETPLPTHTGPSTPFSSSLSFSLPNPPHPFNMSADSGLRHRGEKTRRLSEQSSGSEDVAIDKAGRFSYGKTPDGKGN